MNAGAEGTGLIHALVDRLAAAYAEEPHRAEIALAREDYFTRSGKVFEDDGELFERRVASFLEWYVLDRPLAGGSPPVVRALEDDAPAGTVAGAASGPFAGAPAATRRALAHLATSHRTLFDLVAVHDSTLVVEDVLGGARFTVLERRSTIGFEEGDLMEARAVWDGQQLVFGKTFLFHPRDARDEALAAVEGAVKRGIGRDEILFQLARMHVRWHRHGHVGAARVYRGG